MTDRHRAAYLAFDRFPSAKGSAVHIRHMAAELFDRYGGGLLCVLGGGDLPAYQREGGVEIVRFTDVVPNLLDRAEAFSRWAADRLAPHRDTLEICHVRDPWGALPALSTGGRLVYEANGLPSIELPYAWPLAAPSTLAKIRELEEHCLREADAVVVPSRVISKAVTGRGAEPDRVHLVPNGADPVPAGVPRPPTAPDRYVIYVGALQPWQGVDVLLRAFARLADLTDLTLVVCSSVSENRARPLRRLAERLGVPVRWEHQLPHAEVAAWLAHAELSVAPLTACPRNLDQGCSPIKVWESMAAGTAVVASDLPVIREVLGEHGRLVPPDRPAELARAVRVLLEYPEACRDLGARARRHVEDGFTWKHARARLADVYDRVEAH
ncbi:glycosyltransferase family 4 protein [Actinoplanes sp. NPDC049802]|uniref:glycosyltransferase family 4 protein n=1 Tax=Actinoplanes sp. NPDC049802 TaxID=3154742 RepID=UPI00340C1824